MSYLFDRDFYLELSKGLVPKHSDYSTMGFNADIDTGTAPEDIWGHGGVFTPPTAARQHNLASTSPLDFVAGTGLRTVRVFGVTAVGFETEDINMNGVANVLTTKSYFDIYDLVPLTFGALGTNSGVITATAQTDATVTASIEIDGFNRMARAIRYVPDGYKAYIHDVKSSMTQNTAASNAQIVLSIRTSGIWAARGFSLLNNAGVSDDIVHYQTPIKILSGSWIRVRCTNVSNSNTAITSQLNITLVQD